MTDLIGSAGKSGPRRTKGIVDGVPLQRKGDVLANQDTCVAALRGEHSVTISEFQVLLAEINHIC